MSSNFFEHVILENILFTLHFEFRLEEDRKQNIHLLIVYKGKMRHRESLPSHSKKLEGIIYLFGL